MKITDIAQIMESLSKLDPEQVGQEIRSQTAPFMQVLAAISHGLDDLNAHLDKLIEQNEKRDKDAGN